MGHDPVCQVVRHGDHGRRQRALAFVELDVSDERLIGLDEVERCEQRRRAMALIVMGSPLCDTWCQ